MWILIGNRFTYLVGFPLTVALGYNFVTEYNKIKQVTEQKSITTNSKKKISTAVITPLLDKTKKNLE